ncbi:PAS domain S-box protein [Terasakiella sp. A23]|uniref:PAS domain S-box protein n=1 Tax=Terasakiella sp. FCG-A23 TaxID=3080561 RepID=UPI0029541AE5|nr:PAS domain S-box protein [Terasakiella sp. A23]MDV7338726.1 PAS domain S-box protein [Terasakiella sp. A23]
MNKKPNNHTTSDLRDDYALSLLQRRHAHLEEYAQIGSFEWDVENGEFWWSDQILKIFEIKEFGKPITFQKLISFIHPVDQGRINSLIDDLTRDGPSIRTRCKILSARGREIPILLMANAMDNTGKIKGYIQDISIDSAERESLLDTLAKYRGVMASAGDAIILISQEGQILEGNAKAAEILETTEDEISQLSVDNIHEPGMLEAMMGHYQAMLWGQTELVESTVVGKNNKCTIVEVTGRPVDIASEQMLVVILHDVSIQHKAQNALKRSEQRYRSLVDEAREGILLVDEQNVILAANPKICETLQMKRSEILNATFLDVADFDLDVSPIDLLNKTPKRSSMHMEGYLTAKDGQLHPTGFNVARYEEQNNLRYIVTAYDLTDVREGEEDRLQLQKQLYQAQKRELMGQLAGSLAHDFNNLLSPILLVSEVLMEDAEDDPFLKKNLNNINQAAQRARRLVGRILDYTKPEESSFLLLDLRHEINETLELLRSSVPHTIVIDEIYSDDTFRCMADPDQIHQIVMNVGTNAAQAIGEQNGKIVFKTEAFDIDEKSSLIRRHEIPEGRYVRISVTDDGPGIDMRYIDEIFDPFFTTKTQTDGSGLGLSVVERIATQHGGFVEAKNIKDSGACISIYLPLEVEIKS